MPITRNNKVIGVLLAVSDGESLSLLTDEITYKEEGYSYIIDETGRDIAHRNRDFVRDGNNTIELVSTDHPLKSVAAAFRTILEMKARVEQYSYEKEDYYLGYAPIEGTSWTFILTANEDEVLDAIPSMVAWISIGITMVLALGIVVVFLQEI